METVQIYGHTIGTIYNKEFFSPLKLSKQLEVKCRKTRGIKSLGLQPRLRQIKLEFTRTHILINAYQSETLKSIVFIAIIPTCFLAILLIAFLPNRVNRFFIKAPSKLLKKFKQRNRKI